MKFHHPLRFAWTASILGLIALPAIAQTDGTPTSSPSSDAWNVKVGVGASISPRYMGSDKTFVQAAPFLSVEKGIFFLDPLRGIGARYDSESGFSISEAIGYDLGRLDRNKTFRPGSRDLKGMGDVPGSIVSRTLVEQRLSSVLSASAEFEYALRSGINRTRYRVGVEMGLLRRSSDDISLNIDVHGGNAAFNRAYFGVSPLQSARSGFAVHKADAGVFAYSAGATWTHMYNARWSSTVTLTGTRYTSDAGNSPIVKRRNTAETAFAMIYAL